MFKSTYETMTKSNSVSLSSALLYSWDSNSTYIHEPPFFKNITTKPPGPREVKDAYCLMNFGDNITTDNISPAGTIHEDSPAAKFLIDRYTMCQYDFNSYGSRRGNHEVMTRGTFASTHIVNKLLNGEVGPKTVHIPTGEDVCVYDAASVSKICYYKLQKLKAIAYVYLNISAEIQDRWTGYDHTSWCRVWNW